MIFSKKPRMMEKFKKHYNKHRHNNFIRGGDKEFAPWGVTLNHDNRCNFKCKHCFTRSSQGDFKQPVLSMEEVADLAVQCDELGIFEFDLQGGEPLMNPKLFEILKAIDTSKFYTYLTTNGYYLTEEKAVLLAEAGVDKLNISIDSFDPDEHDEFRGKKGAYNGALNAAKYAKQAGMKAYFSVTLGNYNASSDELKEFARWAKSEDIGLVINCASPVGSWRGNYDMMLRDEDSKTIETLREDNPNVIRDLWSILNTGSLITGCPAINLLYINPYGDVLPCAYMHANMGNIREKSLKEILENGFKYEQINKLSPKCLTGEDINFAKKYLNQDTTVMNPKPIAEYFSK